MTRADRQAAARALLQDSRLWTGAQAAMQRAVPTGFAPLDAVLPGGGWPLGALTEVLVATPGLGEV